MEPRPPELANRRRPAQCRYIPRPREPRPPIRILAGALDGTGGPGGLRPSRKRQSYGGRNTRPRTQAGAIRRRCWKGAVVALEIINPDPRYSKVHLIEPAPLGYLHLAADVQAPHRPGPGAAAGPAEAAATRGAQVAGQAAGPARHG